MSRTNINYNWKRFWVPEDTATQEYGYLRDPDERWGDKRYVTFETLQNTPCLILLGNPGMGKSKIIVQIAKDTRERGDLCVLKNLAEYGDFAEFIASLESEPDFQSWKDSSDNKVLHLFLDSLDEGRLENKKLEHDLERYLRLLPFDRLYLRVTCRAAELPTDFIPIMKGLWPEKIKLNLYKPTILPNLEKGMCIKRQYRMVIRE